MSTTLLLLLSGALISAGLGIIWRDIRKRRRDTFVVQRDAQTLSEHDPDLEITAVARPAGSARADAGARAVPLPDGTSSADAAARWVALQPILREAVEQVGAQFAVGHRWLTIATGVTLTAAGLLMVASPLLA